jgi:TrmH family RNA methyltransferase
LHRPTCLYRVGTVIGRQRTRNARPYAENNNERLYTNEGLVKLEYITSRRNSLAVHIKKLGVSRRYREEHGEFLCDGIKLLEDAVNCGVEITAVLTSSQLLFPLSSDTRVYSADRDLINSLSPLKNSQDTLFTCRMRSSAACGELKGSHILLEGLQDPGNIGAIIRTANALGVDSILLTGDCADYYNPKAVRASMGAVFRQEISKITLDELSILKDNGCGIIGAVLDEGSRDIRDVSLSDSIIAIGREGSGLTQDLLSLCSQTVMIPIARASDSLNAAVAAAIIMWEMMKCRR